MLYYKKRWKYSLSSHLESLLFVIFNLDNSSIVYNRKWKTLEHANVYNSTGRMLQRIRIVRAVSCEIS